MIVWLPVIENLYCAALAGEVAAIAAAQQALKKSVRFMQTSTKYLFPRDRTQYKRKSAVVVADMLGNLQQVRWYL
ncbi:MULTISPECIES: hypothetical protein [Sphingomonas]|uniref:Uncharacterized protein n=1 Tax=Sphingomonas trueperi TaxID=53317 RepID=A0A7X6BBK5_9SPHN|nr:MULTISPECIES: hypothetical protein [unclassified Sphingomonas]NJB95971.1 hypothetical protein [Sphingomonas trueperi]